MNITQLLITSIVYTIAGFWAHEWHQAQAARAAAARLVPVRIRSSYKR